MKKKILLASGCSCTDQNFTSDYHPDLDCSWPMWPELLAKKLNMEWLNFGHCGAGNGYVYTSLLDQIVKMNPDDIGLVIPAWTQAQRKDIKIRGIWKHLDQVRNYPYYKHRTNHGDIQHRIQESIILYYSLQEICKSKKIPLNQFQMLPMFLGFDWDPIAKKHKDGRENAYKILVRTIYNNPYYHEINNNFLGWPTENYIGGFNIKMDVLHGYNKKGLKYQISDIDSHPNAKGQEKIAEILYEKINR
jgi:hypothetical protein